MTKHMACFIFTLLSLTQGHAQYQWSKFYNICPDPNVFSGAALSQYADSNIFISVGNTSTPGVTTQNSYIAIFDYNLQLQRVKHLYAPGQYNNTPWSNNVTKVSTNRYVFAGNEFDVLINSNFQVLQPFFYFFDRNGDSLNYVKYTDTSAQRQPTSVMADKQKNVVIGGNITSSSYHPVGPLDHDYDLYACWLAKYDTFGYEIWSKMLFGGWNDHYYGRKVINSHDGLHYLVSGLNDNRQFTTTSYFIAKTDTAGNVIWKKHYPYTFKYSNDIDIAPVRNGQYAYACTYADSFVNGHPYGAHMQFGKINEDGDTLWRKTFRHNSISVEGLQISEGNNGDLFVFGGSYYQSIYRPVLLCTDSNGNTKWYREYLHVDNIGVTQRLYAMSVLPDKRMLMSGYVACNPAIPGVFDTTGSVNWYVLTDSFGCRIPGCNLGDTIWHTGVQEINKITANWKVYPNPVTDVLNVETSYQGRAEIQIMDMTGRKLLQQNITSGSKIDMRGYATGIYMYRILGNGIVQAQGKVVKE